MNCDFTLCRHNNSAELNKEGLCTCKSPEKFCKYLQLKEQIEKMKADVKQGQSYWNSGEMQYRLFQRLLDKWEIKEND